MIDPERPQQRYCLCRNPETAACETTTRQRLLDLTQGGLAKIAARKKKGAADRLGAQVGKLLAPVMQQRLQPLFEQDGQDKHRQWTMENVIERLKGIRRQRVRANGVEFDQVSQPDEEQQKILDLLKIRL